MSRAKRQELRERLAEACRRANELAQRVAALREERSTGGIADVLAGRGGVALGRTPILARELEPGHLGKVYAVDWAAYNDHDMCTVAQDSKLFVWNALSAIKLGALRMPSSFTMACAMKPDDGSLIVTGGLQNLVQVFSRSAADGGDASAACKAELVGHEGYIANVCFSDANTVVTASGDSTVRVWDLEREQAKAVLVGHGERNPKTGDYEGGDVMSVSISRTDPNVALTGSIDALAKIWDLRTGEAVQTFHGHEMDINAVDFLPSGRAFVTGSEDAESRLWDTRSATQVNRFTSHYVLSAVSCVCTSLSGRLLFAGYDDRSCCVWDMVEVGAERPLYLLQHHERRISSLGINRSGHALATGSWDNKIAVCA